MLAVEKLERASVGLCLARARSAAAVAARSMTCTQLFVGMLGILRRTVLKIGELVR